MSYKMLCVDDEPGVLQSLKRLFRREGYEMFFAGNAHDALEILKKENIHLIMTDYRMPEMNGVEFLKKSIEIHPESLRLILSGYADAKVVCDAIDQGQVYRFLTKPWNDEELLESIRQCFEHIKIETERNSLLQQAKQEIKA
ncbi:MAG: response regulator [Deltaproteobacteria bacterium]|nr:MAG: response regulator [Deltaproteobacteria bacterium]